MKPSMSVWMLGVVTMFGSLAWAADKPEDFSGLDVSNRDFTKYGKSLVNASFEDATCKSTNFTGVLLKGANFQGANLYDTRFGDADLTGADLRGASIVSTFFSRAKLDKANLQKLDFSLVGLNSVSFREADLRNLKGISTVSDADFTKADLRGANLVGLRISETVKFRNAKYDSKTRWPKGFDVEASGAVPVEEKEEDEKPSAKPETESPKKSANKPAGKKLEAEFAELDTNEDGRLSGKELRGLEAYDKNKDGRVTLEEFIAGREKE